MRQKGIVLDMATKTNQKVKREKKMAKRAKIDKITNRFMINLVWGIVLIIVMLYMQDVLFTRWQIMKYPAIVFAVAAVALFVCGKLNVIKNKTRAYDYSIFMAVLAICSCIIAYYHKIRLVVGTGLDSRWWVLWGPIALTLAYLVFSFIWTVVSIAIIERKK